MWAQATREALGLCPPPCVFPCLRGDWAGAVLHQGTEAVKAEIQEMLQVGITIPAEVTPAIRDIPGSCRNSSRGQAESHDLSFEDQKAKLKINV